MRKFIIGGLAVVGGGFILHKVGTYVMQTYRKEIRAAVLDKTVTYFFDEIEEDPDKPVDPIRAAFLAYVDAKKGAQK